MLRICMTYSGRKKILTKNAGHTYGRPAMHPAKPINN